MKIIEHAPDSGYNDLDNDTFQLDREIIKIEQASHHSIGFIYALVTFSPVSEDSDKCYMETLNEQYTIIAKFDTEFEGETWEAGQ
jgi:hypothetical protein